jgi:serine/threonine protein kinase
VSCPLLLLLPAQPDGGDFHRDIKPDNIVVNPVTCLSGLLDYGCAMGVSGSRYCKGGTPGYTPPEMAVLTDGLPATYLTAELRQAATHASADLFLLCRIGCEIINGRPVELDATLYDWDDLDDVIDAMEAVLAVDWSPQLAALASAGHGDMADFLAWGLSTDPEQRPTPAQALAHPFLAAAAVEVAAAVDSAMPSFVSGNQEVLDLLAGLEGQQYTFLAHQCNLPGAVCGCSLCSANSVGSEASSSGSSRGSPELSWSNSSSMADTPSMLSLICSCRSGSREEASQQQQQEAAEPMTSHMSAATCTMTPAARNSCSAAAAVAAAAAAAATVALILCSTPEGHKNKADLLMQATKLLNCAVTSRSRSRKEKSSNMGRPE